MKQIGVHFAASSGLGVVDMNDNGSQNGVARYAVAKYVPDMRRMEPRNIGIVVWSHGTTGFKFMVDEDARTFVNDYAAYDRWVTYWGKILAADAVKPRRSEPVPKHDKNYFDAFLKTQKGNYRLFDGGESVEAVAADDVQDFADFLFDELITPPTRAVGTDMVKPRSIINGTYISVMPWHLSPNG